MKIVVDTDIIIDVEKFKLKEYKNIQYIILKLNSIWEVYEFNTGLRIMPDSSYDKNFSKTRKGLEQNLFKMLDSDLNRNMTILCIHEANWLNNSKPSFENKEIINNAI
ncbi:MAG: hypothetical protein Q8P20_01175 [bacterium]|nr:hypothetical protein [bacterium]